MKNFVRKIVGSLDTVTKDAFSARKLSAFVAMACAVAAEIVWLKHAYNREDFALLGEVLMIDFFFVSVCLGLTTWEKFKLKEPKNEKAD